MALAPAQGAALGLQQGMATVQARRNQESADFSTAATLQTNQAKLAQQARQNALAELKTLKADIKDAVTSGNLNGAITSIEALANSGQLAQFAQRLGVPEESLVASLQASIGVDTPEQTQEREVAGAAAKKTAELETTADFQTRQSTDIASAVGGESEMGPSPDLAGYLQRKAAGLETPADLEAEALAKARGTAAGDPTKGAAFPGTGAPNTARRVLAEIAPKYVKGGWESLTIEEKNNYALAYGELTKSTFNPATGFFETPTLEERQFPRPAAGVAVTGTGVPTSGSRETDSVIAGPKPGEGRTGDVRVKGKGRVKDVPPERGGKEAMMLLGRKEIKQVTDFIVDPVTKKVARGAVFYMWSNFPFSDGRTARARLENALQSKLRLETGATANESEIEGIVDRFMPNPMLDSDATIIDRMNRLREFFDTAIERTDPQLFKTLIERAKDIPEVPAGLPDGTVFAGNSPRGNPTFRTPGPDGKLFEDVPAGVR